jgi:hypothetical protein
MNWSDFALAKFVQLFDPAIARKGGGVLNKSDSEETTGFVCFNSEETFSSSLCLPVRSSPKADEGGVTKSGLKKKIILINKRT